MSMLQFVNPGFLWLALLGILPPLIHLLGRRKPRRLRFPPFEFVRRCEEKSRSRRRLRSMLLLVLRTLLLVFVPLAIARPFLAAPAAAQGTGFALQVVILDNSMSASQAAGGETALDRMKQRAREIASATSPANRFVLATAANPPALVTPFPAASPDLAREAIGSVKPTYASTSIGGAVGLARGLVEAAAPQSAKGYLLSDLARHAFREAEDLSIGLGDERVSFEIFDPVPNPGQNLSLVSAEVRGTAEGVRITATIANHSRAAAGTEIKVSIAGAALRPAAVEVPARGTAEAVFETAHDRRSPVFAEVALHPDALTQDNVLPFARPPGRETAVLLVNGDPRTVSHADETFYFERALSAGGEGAFVVMSTFPEALPDDLSRFDAIALLNCGPFATAAATRLDEFVRGGGGLLVSAGDHTDPASHNAMGWLPARFPQSASANAAPGLLVPAAGHPALSPFAGGAEGLGVVKITRRFELVPAPGAQVFLETADGRPLSAAGRHGDGRVIVFGSSLDRDWGDWPIRPSYLPAMGAFVKYLSRGREAWETYELRVGEKRVLKIEACPATLRAAGGNPEPQELQCRAENGGAVATVSGPPEPGLYEITTPAGRTAYLVVRTDPAESDLEKTPREEVEAALGIKGRSALRSLVGFGANEGSGPALWSWVLLAIVLVLGAEQWVTRRG
ncbi:MAG: BatA domain-containing protein [Deltaproteobacteria bacterium]|nr:BatA domain-containing protein [Deltaproteobacteria bacterium]